MAARSIVITGVTGGLGRAMALGFAASGHRVAGCGRRAEPIEALAREATDRCRFEALDVAAGPVERWAEAITKEFGAPDLVINNAAMINEPQPLWEVPEHEFATLLDVNLMGVHRVCRAFLPTMIERGSGVVVNISSGWGRTTSPGVAPYCATKFGVEGLTRALAQDLPPGLAAVALNPGVIDTPMLRTAWGDGAGAYPNPERWAKRAVPFFLSLGPQHNGASLDVPG